MQYAFTPASLILLVVSLGLGWVRQRQSTTASIFAHFVYNFIIQFQVVLQVGGGSF
jgi:membrane protease YdiL (CAAX protease family)